VHAGQHGIYSKLGQLGNSEVLLAGASNAGLVEPAHNTALTLVQITSHLFPDQPTLFDLIGLNIVQTTNASNGMAVKTVAGKKIRWGKPRAGSIPAARTTRLLVGAPPTGCSQPASSLTMRA
jgi:hypothetical protein